MNQKDNLFDGKFTYLDAVKVALLIVTGFSTWNVVGIMTPDGSWAWVRQIAALIVVEGAFLGFEYATADAKSRRQVRWATIGFFCSLTVISLFAGLSGLLEFGGDTLMTQHASDWLGLSWSVGDAVQASSLLTLVLWIALLASIYRIYTLNDPGKRAELESIEIGEEVSSEANKARRLANRDVAPVVAGHRALAEIRSRYSGEMSAEQMQLLLDDVADSLKNNYAVRPDTDFVRTSAPVSEPSGLKKMIRAMQRFGKSAPSPVHDVAIDPERGFVPRVPPMQKDVAPPVEELHYHPMAKLQPMEKEIKTIYLFAGVTTNGLGEQVNEGDQLTAKLAEDGRYDVSRFGTGRTFVRLTLDELHMLAGDKDLEEAPDQAEVKPLAGDFRPSKYEA